MENQSINRAIASAKEQGRKEAINECLVIANEYTNNRYEILGSTAVIAKYIVEKIEAL
jgi:hypothetical protein